MNKLNKQGTNIIGACMALLVGLLIGINYTDKFSIILNNILNLSVVFIVGWGFGSITKLYSEIKDSSMIYKAKEYIKTSTIEFVILIVSILATLIFGVLSFSDKVISNEITLSLLQIIFSSIATWIVTKYANKETFDKEQKQTAIRSYRHSLSTKNKIDYSLEVINLINSDIIKCNSTTGNENCILSHNLSRIKDSLVVAKLDASANIDDWSDILSDELNRLRIYKDKDDKIKRLQSRIQLLNPDDEHESEKIKATENQIEELEKEKEDVIKNLNSKIKHSLYVEEKARDEYMVYIENEKEDKLVKQTKGKINIGNILEKSNVQSDDKVV